MPPFAVGIFVACCISSPDFCGLSIVDASLFDRPHSMQLGVQLLCPKRRVLRQRASCHCFMADVVVKSTGLPSAPTTSDVVRVIAGTPEKVEHRQCYRIAIVVGEDVTSSSSTHVAAYDWWTAIPALSVEQRVVSSPDLRGSFDFAAVPPGVLHQRQTLEAFVPSLVAAPALLRCPRPHRRRSRSMWAADRLERDDCSALNASNRTAGPVFVGSVFAQQLAVCMRSAYLWSGRHVSDLPDVRWSWPSKLIAGSSSQAT